MISIVFTGLDSAHPNSNSSIKFISWQQRPMQQQQQVEYTTRLGSSQLVISKTKKESNASNVTAIMASDGASVAESINSLETSIKTLRDNIGKRFQFIDENNIVIERCYIVNMSYNIKAVSGAYKAIANISMVIMSDIAPTTGN